MPGQFSRFLPTSVPSSSCPAPAAHVKFTVQCRFLKHHFIQRFQTVQIDMLFHQFHASSLLCVVKAEPQPVDPTLARLQLLHLSARDRVAAAVYGAVGRFESHDIFALHKIFH